MRARVLKSALALACGVLLFLSCADFDIWPLTWVAVAPLIAVVLDPDVKRPAWYGFLCGLTANGGGFYWIVGFLERFGHLPFVAAAPIFSLLIAYQAITFALWAWLLRRLSDQLPSLPTVFLAPVTYVAVELVVPYVFPWYLAITQAWVRPVIQVAELTGPLGVSFLLILSNAALYEAWRGWRRERKLPAVRMGVAFGAVALCLAYGVLRIHQVEAKRAQAPKLAVGVVQANIGIHEKWRPELAAEQLAVHQQVSQKLERDGADLVVWPESSYPYVFRRDQAHDWPEMDAREAKRGFSAPLLFGSLTAGSGARYPYNTALLLDESANVRGMFDKNILMVFGEYIPYYEQLKFIKEWIPETSNFARGTDVATFEFQPKKLGGRTVTVGPMICYEDIFPSFGRRLVRKDPNLLVNITNDAWFGRTSEPYEHLALAVYRTVETRLDLVRAVNTGVSAIIDSTGRVQASSPSVDPDETPDAKPVALEGEIAVQEPQKLYAHLGEWFGGLCLLLVVIFVERGRHRAGEPVRWRLVGIAVAALIVGACAVVLIMAGPARLGLALALVSHRTLKPGIEDVAFRTGLTLVPALVLGCALAGFFAVRAARGPAPLEASLAVLAVMVAPALAFGTLEGEQAGLVLSALAGILVAALAGRIARGGTMSPPSGPPQRRKKKG